MKNNATYKVKWELKNYDNLSEEQKRWNDRWHYDTTDIAKGNKVRIFKSREAAEKRVARLKALGNDAYEITVVEC